MDNYQRRNCQSELSPLTSTSPMLMPSRHSMTRTQSVPPFQTQGTFTDSPPAIAEGILTMKLVFPVTMTSSDTQLMEIDLWGLGLFRCDCHTHAFQARPWKIRNSSSWSNAGIWSQKSETAHHIFRLCGILVLTIVLGWCKHSDHLACDEISNHIYMSERTTWQESDD